MDIILLERVANLGGMGDVVSVKDGYARNFLLPQKKALRANESNRKVYEANRERLEVRRHHHHHRIAEPVHLDRHGCLDRQHPLARDDTIRSQHRDGRGR